MQQFAVGAMEGPIHDCVSFTIRRVYDTRILYLQRPIYNSRIVHINLCKKRAQWLISFPNSRLHYHNDGKGKRDDKDLIKIADNMKKKIDKSKEQQ